MVEKYIESGYEMADLCVYDAVRTDGLDACIAIVTHTPDGNSASLAHLVYDYNFDEYLDWLKTNVEVNGASVYLVGGIDYFEVSPGGRVISSVEPVQKLEQKITNLGYHLLAKDVLGRKTRNVALSQEGIVTVEWKDYGSRTSWQSKALTALSE